MNTTGIHKVPGQSSNQTTPVPPAAVLTPWNNHSWDDGLHIDQLSSLDRLTVLTQHSTYEIVIVSPANGEVLVGGGEFFPEFTRGRLAGSPLRGRFPKKAKTSSRLPHRVRRRTGRDRPEPRAHDLGRIRPARRRRNVITSRKPAPASASPRRSRPRRR